MSDPTCNCTGTEHPIGAGPCLLLELSQPVYRNRRCCGTVPEEAHTPWCQLPVEEVGPPVHAHDEACRSRGGDLFCPDYHSPAVECLPSAPCPACRERLAMAQLPTRTLREILFGHRALAEAQPEQITDLMAEINRWAGAR